MTSVAGGPEPLLERERELTALRNVLTLAQQGRGGVALIEAPAGLGKTSLLRAVYETAAEAGFVCLRARATELERDFAYGCVRQLLEPLVARVSDPERNRLFEGAAALSKPLFAPTDLSQRPPSADSAFSMLHGLYWLLNNITDEGPLVLAVDDIHWSDAESLRFFNYLAPRLDGLSLAVLATTRSGENVTADLARLAVDPESTVLRPRPLSTGAAPFLPSPLSYQRRFLDRVACRHGGRERIVAWRSEAMRAASSSRANSTACPVRGRALRFLSLKARGRGPGWP